ncbi:putative HTH-type transcriptional regulator YpoP [Virgibacillus pantothenticus]|uniref:MarR family transcriptional regulator n=2 Tax=Virgibacillus pantothenticus TaxID=1473 RepID=UPI001B234BF1|nr:MarR family transcriptional regulator [Virgibacillus pantothenticus]MBU8566168.1 MarR family transcriptional regulator [Virgibacillus pantothenticus]MBU8600536.1 MarR family transcriptional regulator [Virgibacillus pantothenticus]MBU8634488.1 MarR family transcriptional regulator [Virgibacillus pantothenticus]MBU8642675.1 MarR family transcriptional regulator [Virgibacillus pantothenticus]MBU8647089.1 MarR family transcriptional regulator [Virgibacillus pantothenticus]
MTHVESIMKEIAEIQYKSKQFMDMLTVDEDLPANQLVLLVKLKISGGMKAAEIASFAGVTPGAVTAMCDKLKKAGLITRLRDKEDRRVVTIQLTTEGEKYVQKVFAKFGSSQLREMTTILHEVNQLMSKILSRI